MHSMLKTLSRLAGLASLALAATFANAQPQSFPAKPIRLVVPFPPGGSADIVAREVALPLSRELGQPIVVDNKAGADGAIAADTVLKAAPDGYTLLLGTNTAMLAVPTLRKAAPYDPTVDFTAISLVGRFGFFLFVNPEVPARDVRQLLAHVRANPGKLAYGTGNSSGILAVAQLARLEKLDLLHVPYKGDAPATVDLIAGRIGMMVATPGTAMPYVQGGKLRVLATLLPERSPLVPEAPTMAEAGVTGLNITPWAALFGPAKMPREVADRLALAMQSVLARPDLKEKLRQHAFEAASSTPPELASYVKDQFQVWQQTVREAGIARD